MGQESKQVMNNCFLCIVIHKKSQAKGLRDPKYGCTFEPFVFIECRRALPGETGANGLEPVPLQLQPWALSGKWHPTCQLIG